MKLLVVEDDLKLASLLQRALTEEGYVVDCCANGEDALIRGRSGLYDLIVLDWMLPGKSGLEVCRQLREVGITIPVLMLTARGELDDRVMGLNVGADAYMVKPFELTELFAHVNALLRRALGHGALKLGCLEINRVDRQVRLDAKSLELSAREYSVLLYLAQHADQMVTRTELLENVWSLQFDPGSNIVEVYINRLRMKLGRHVDKLETVRRRGYILHSKDPET